MCPSLAHHLIRNRIARLIANEPVLNRPQTIEAIVPAKSRSWGTHELLERHRFVCLLHLRPAWRADAFRTAWLESGLAPTIGPGAAPPR
jgi:hypothetical protein